MATRFERVQVTLSAEEREIITEAARQEGLNLAAFMRWAALRAARND